MLWVYRFIAVLLSPLALMKLKALSRSCSPTTQALNSTRLGHLPNTLQGQRFDVWLHGASVGEIQMLQPLVEHFCQAQHRVLVTSFTPTGLDRVAAVFGERVAYAFLPLDTRAATCRWLDGIAPGQLIVAETELWPELYHQCAKRSLPIVLVNGRLSTNRLKHYRRWLGLYRHALDAIAIVACQSEADAQRWQSLGLKREQTPTTGNLKAQAMGAVEPPAFTESPGFIWTAGSVHSKEDEMVLHAHLQLLKSQPNARLILAPRHLKHLDRIREQLKDLGLPWSPFDPLKALTDKPVHLIEGMGSLMAAYQRSDVAYVGGSAVPVGGHSLYEPASLKKPILTGPHLHDQQVAADALQRAGALQIIADASALASALAVLAEDRAMSTHMGEAAHSVVVQAAGGLERTLAAIEPYLKLDGAMRTIATVD